MSGIELEEANIERAALNDAGGTLTDKASASEQNATASEILSQLEVKVGKPERTVLRRRNIAALLRMEASGLSGRIDFSKRQSIVTAKYSFLL